MQEFDDSASPIANWDQYWADHPELAVPSPVVHQITRLLGKSIAGKRILEVGAGSGRDIVAVAKTGAVAYALDKSAEARRHISALAQREGVDVTVSGNDLRATGFSDDFFDVVYSQGVVEHFKDVEPVIREQCRILHKGGFLIVDVPQTFNPYTIYKHLAMLRGTWPPGWETQFSPWDLRKIGRRFGLQTTQIYAWGEHGNTLLGRLLSLLDRCSWTATCIGAVYEKP